jgi:cytoskeletal protein RodZ
MIRESMGVSVEEMAQFTKINKNYLKAIEEDDYARLPAPVFLRGFLVQIAKKLHLPEEQLTSAYLTRVRQNGPSKD